MHCCETTAPQPAAEGGPTAPLQASAGHRLKSGLGMSSCLWIMVGGLAVLALAGPALGVPAQMASLGILLLCPLSMGVMMVMMGRRGHQHG